MEKEKLVLKCPKCVTTQRVDFPQHSSKDAAKLADKPLQTDPALIAGHNVNNLKVNNVQQRTKAWPTAMTRREEYQTFLKRLKCCKEHVYNLYFESPKVDIDTVEQMLKDLEKTTYQMCYSPNEYATMRKSARTKRFLKEPTHMKYYETIYRTYYNRIDELDNFKDYLYKQTRKEDNSEVALRNELRKYFTRYTTTTYYNDICVPAKVTSENIKVSPGPIDRYTNRRI